MKNILSGNHQKVLQEFAHSHLLMAFDYDGTLAPIVTNPDQARMRARTRTLLFDLSRLYPCALISGRAYSDLRAHTRGLRLKYLVGNHGAEWDPKHHSKKVEGQVHAWEERLAAALDEVPGIEFENKGLSLSVHFRQAPREATRIQRLAHALPGARVIGGKAVVNLVPRGAADKGEALLRLLSETGCERAVYVGDDVTDEDVFRLRDPRILTIRVGQARKSRAEYYLCCQREVDRFMAIMKGARPGKRARQSRKAG